MLVAPSIDALHRHRPEELFAQGRLSHVRQDRRLQRRRAAGPLRHVRRRHPRAAGPQDLQLRLVSSQPSEMARALDLRVLLADGRHAGDPRRLGRLDVQPILSLDFRFLNRSSMLFSVILEAAMATAVLPSQPVPTMLTSRSRPRLTRVKPPPVAWMLLPLTLMVSPARTWRRRRPPRRRRTPATGTRSCRPSTISRAADVVAEMLPVTTSRPSSTCAPPVTDDAPPSRIMIAEDGDRPGQVQPGQVDHHVAPRAPTRMIPPL